VCLVNIYCCSKTDTNVYFFSTLFTLASSYSNRYPGDARYSPQEENRLLRRAPKNPAASLTGDSISEAPQSFRMPETDTSPALTERSEATALSKFLSDSLDEESWAESDRDDGKYEAGPRSGTSGTSLSSRAAISELPSPVSSTLDSGGDLRGGMGGIAYRISRMQLRKALPLPPVARLFGVSFSWIFVFFFSMLDAFAEKNGERR